MPSQHKNPLIGWHSDDPTLKVWIETEAERRGMTKKALLDEIVGNHRMRHDGAAGKCPHPPRRVIKGFCGACGTSVGTSQRGG